MVSLEVSVNALLGRLTISGQGGPRQSLLRASRSTVGCSHSSGVDLVRRRADHGAWRIAACRM